MNYALLSLGSGLTDLLNKALNTWNNRFNEIIDIITQSPETFREGKIWNVIVDINGALQVIGISLLVVFFLMGIVKTTTNFKDLHHWQNSIALFIRFILAKSVITYGLPLILWIMSFVQGIISKILQVAHIGSGTGVATQLPAEVIAEMEGAGLLSSIGIFTVTLLGWAVITILSFAMILTVYGRFFKLYMYAAVSPLPLATFAGEPTQRIGFSFTKSFVGVAMQGAIIVVCCIIFSAFASTAPEMDPSASGVSLVWDYLGETIFNMLILFGTIKGSDMVVRNMMGN